MGGNKQPFIATTSPLTPTSAYLNSTIYFTVTGQYFQTGSGMTWVNFTNVTGTRIFNNANITINSVTPTSINGTMVIGADASPGKWNLTVNTTDGGQSLVKINAMTVSKFPAPTITSIAYPPGTLAQRFSSPSPGRISKTSVKPA